MSLIQAFITGAQFALSAHQLAQDAKAKKEEAEGHWVTIGAEAGPDGAKHGGRPVFIEGGEPKGKKAESKKAESKKAAEAKKKAEAEAKKKAEAEAKKKAEAEAKKKAEAEAKKKAEAEAKKKADKKAKAIKAAEDKYNASIGDFLKSQKHAPGSFAKELMYCLPGKADTFEKLCSNLSDDCKYLVKHALTKTNYFVLPPNEEQAFFSRADNGVHFKPKLFKDGKWLCGMTNHQVIMHEFGHAVDSYPLIKGIAPKITMNTRLLNALSTDTSRIISALRAETDKNYSSPAYSQQQADDRVAKYLEDIMYSRDENSDIHSSVVASVSDMISAHTMNAIKDGGYHKTEYWQSKYAKSTEFIAHVFETSIDPELKKQFYNLFPTATKVLEELISNTATTIRKEVAKGKIK